MIYLIEIPLAGSDQWYEVCRCDHAAHVGAVMAAILGSSHPPAMIRVTVIHP